MCVCYIKYIFNTILCCILYIFFLEFFSFVNYKFNFFSKKFILKNEQYKKKKKRRINL